MSVTNDVLIRGARIVDGSGNPWFYGDVAIAGERIAAIAPPGSIPSESAREVVDATGMVVCPGFIDIQSHSIVPLMVDGRCLSKITQGVTTEIMGEGWTPAPIGGRNLDDLHHTPYAELMNGARRRPAGPAFATGWKRRFGRAFRRTSARSSVAAPCASTVAVWTWVHRMRGSSTRCGR